MDVKVPGHAVGLGFGPRAVIVQDQRVGRPGGSDISPVDVLARVREGRTTAVDQPGRTAVNGGDGGVPQVGDAGAELDGCPGSAGVVREFQAGSYWPPAGGDIS